RVEGDGARRDRTQLPLDRARGGPEQEYRSRYRQTKSRQNRTDRVTATLRPVTRMLGPGLFAAKGKSGRARELNVGMGQGSNAAQPPALSMQGSRKKLLCINGVRSFDATNGRLDRDHVKEGRVAARRKGRSTGVRASARQMAEGVSGQVA